MGKLESMITSFIVGLVSTCWLLILVVPTGWHQHTSLIWKFNLGLYQVDIDKGIVTRLMAMGAAEKDQEERSGFQNLLESLTTGNQSLREFRDNICFLSMAGMQEACGIMGETLWSSIAMLLMGFCGVILLMLGGGFGHYYWFKGARCRVRIWTLVMFIAAPLVFLIGMMQYTFFTYGMRRLNLMALVAQAVPGINVVEDETFSKVYVFACVCTVLSFLPLLIMLSFAYKSPFEVVNEEINLRKHENREAAYDQMLNQNSYGGYGSVGSGYNKDVAPQGSEYSFHGYSGAPGQGGPAGPPGYYGSEPPPAAGYGAPQLPPGPPGYYGSGPPPPEGYGAAQGPPGPPGYYGSGPPPPEGYGAAQVYGAQGVMSPPPDAIWQGGV